MFGSSYKFSYDSLSKNKRRKLDRIINEYVKDEQRKRAESNNKDPNATKKRRRKRKNAIHSESPLNNDERTGNGSELAGPEKDPVIDEKPFEEILKEIKGDSWSYNAFLVRKSGFELLPSINPLILKDYAASRRNPLTSRALKKGALNAPPSASFMKYHLNLLNSLLHISIMKQNWMAAYKAYSMIIKLHVVRPALVKFNLIWPIGLLILRKLEEEDWKERVKKAFEKTDKQLKKQLWLVEGDQHMGFESRNRKVSSLASLDAPEHLDETHAKEKVGLFLANERLFILNRKSDKFLQWLVKFKSYIGNRKSNNNASLVIIGAFLWNYIRSLTDYEATFAERKYHKEGENDGAQEEIIKLYFSMMESMFKKVKNQVADYLLQSVFNSSSTFNYLNLLVAFLELKFMVWNYEHNADVTSASSTKIEELIKTFRGLFKDLLKDKSFQFDQDRLMHVFKLTLRDYAELNKDALVSDGMGDDDEEDISNSHDASIDGSFIKVEQSLSTSKPHQQAGESEKAPVPPVDPVNVNSTTVLMSDDSDVTDNEQEGDMFRTGNDLSSDDSEHNAAGATEWRSLVKRKGSQASAKTQNDIDYNDDFLAALGGDENAVEDDDDEGARTGSANQIEDFFSQRRFSFNMFS